MIRKIKALIEDLIDRIYFFLNRKDSVAEELSPSDAYKKFKQAEENYLIKCEKDYQFIISTIESDISRYVNSGEFSIKFRHNNYLRPLNKNGITYIKNHFINKGYTVRCKRKKYKNIEDIIIFIIKWDSWK